VTWLAQGAVSFKTATAAAASWQAGDAPPVHMHAQYGVTAQQIAMAGGVIPTERGILRVQITQAHDLNHKMNASTTHPYVAIRAGFAKGESITKAKTYSPVWRGNEGAVDLYGTMRNFVQLKLELKVMSGGQCLGVTKPKVDLVNVQNLGADNFNVVLDTSDLPPPPPPNKPKVARLYFRVSWRSLGYAKGGLSGGAQIDLDRDAVAQVPSLEMDDAGCMRVTLHSASGLKAADANGSSDPFVVVYYWGSEVHHNHRKLTLQHKRSKVVPRTLNPTFDETLDLYAGLSELKLDGLQFRVLDQDVVHRAANLESADTLGDVSVDLKDIDTPEQARTKAWTAARKRLLSEGNDREATLDRAMQKLKAGSNVNGESTAVKVAHDEMLREGDEAARKAKEEPQTIECPLTVQIDGGAHGKLFATLTWEPEIAWWLKWRNAGNEKPYEAEELTNVRLEAALQQKLEFTLEEWGKFGVVGVRRNHAIKSGTSYFQPVDPWEGRR